MPTTNSQELEEIVQQMLVDYTAWVNGEPLSWNAKKTEALVKIEALLEQARVEARMDELLLVVNNRFPVDSPKNFKSLEEALARGWLTKWDEQRLVALQSKQSSQE